mmetsp:Transcript_25691/g.42223  ORF Transcript_25691/g.42223 Transcript_25691/m.42223 type:complete len:179 (+) Transcript_25691:39-575(+)
MLAFTTSSYLVTRNKIDRRNLCCHALLSCSVGRRPLGPHLPSRTKLGHVYGHEETNWYMKNSAGRPKKAKTPPPAPQPAKLPSTVFSMESSVPKKGISKQESEKISGVLILVSVLIVSALFTIVAFTGGVHAPRAASTNPVSSPVKETNSSPQSPKVPYFALPNNDSDKPNPFLPRPK